MDFQKFVNIFILNSGIDIDTISCQNGSWQTNDSKELNSNHLYIALKNECIKKTNK